MFFIILASTGAQSSAKFKKMVKNTSFIFRTPKKGQKIKISKIPTSLFLNHTKMTITNSQWISTKIEDLHKLFVEISSFFLFAKMDNFSPKS